MMNTKKLFSVCVVLCMTFFLGGCSVGKQQTTGQTPTAVLTDKNAEITITGKLSTTNENFFVTDESGKTYGVESYSIDFSPLVGTQVTVSGQYSGDTLFVSKIE